ncbi:MAG TPA: aspartate/glutamate racemase family protein [Ktedonosporobacter sp.]|nr:aspartate/glutamate racemase family protein [Ktedonosporobacter sp.]
MRTIGLIGGLSWESSIEYYRLINEAVRTQLGGLHSARSIMYSFDFEEIESLQHQGRWEEATRRMIDAAYSVQRGGADFLIICSNTMHKMAGAIQQAIDIPLLHIADATAEQIVAQGLKTIGLLGTKFTMEQDFYKGRLTQGYGLEVLTPDEHEQQIVHDVIYDELCQGVILESSRDAYRQIIANLISRGAKGIILGCTEITLLVKSEDSSVPLFDTTALHALAAVTYALGKEL